jgi:tetratricopeptide (TPR) repeat protein
MRTRALAVASALVALTSPARAELGILVVHVEDPAGKPLAQVRLATKGAGGVGPPTDVAGRTRIPLAPQTQPSAIVAMTLVAPPDLAFISPWDSQVRVPSFENESQNFATIVLGKRGDRATLLQGKPLVNVLANVNLASTPKEPRELSLSERRAEALKQTASAFGLSPADIETAIASLGEQSTDRYARGMATLYQGDLANASTMLAAALHEREQRHVAGSRDAADAAFFLGRTLYDQGKYAEAAAAYRKALSFRPGDPLTMNNLGLSLQQAGNLAEAEPLLTASVAAIELARGKNDPDLVFALDNLGRLLLIKQQPVEAERLFRRGLAIREDTFAATHPALVEPLAGLADAVAAQGRKADAAALYRRAIAIREARFGANDPVAADLTLRLGKTQ